MAIDYQVGDVIMPVAEKFHSLKAKVVDITEKGAKVIFIKGTQKESFFIPNSQMHLFMKDRTGTLLHGNQDRQYSKKDRY